MQKKEAHKNNKKVIQLDKKYRGEKIAIDNNSTSKRNIILIGTLVGVGTASIVEQSFAIFILFLVCIFFISVAVSRMIFISYMKLKFPKQYSYESIEKVR
ncbi:hypothetical protein A5881_001964 [Enterococcus termitis]